MNSGPVCSGFTGTIRVGSHPIICTQCQRLFLWYCNGLPRDQQKIHQGYVCGACGGTNGSTIQPSQIARSQPNNTFFGQTNIAVSNHPCSRMPQQISTPLQRRSTDQPNTKTTAPTEPPRATTVRKCPECKRWLAQVRSPLVGVVCRQQFHVKCARKTQFLCRDWGLQMHGLTISVHLWWGPPTIRPRLTALLICLSKTNIASLFFNVTVIAWPPKLLHSAHLLLDMALTSLPCKRPS